MTSSQIGSSPWWSRWVGVQLIGLALATLAAVARWGVNGANLHSVPAGVVLTGGAAVLLLFLRKPLVVGIGVAAAVTVASHLPVERLDQPPSSDLAAAASMLQLSGVLLAVVAGVGALTIVARRVRWVRFAPVVGLLGLAPLCAEYLSAYDDSTGHPVELLSGLVVFVPLYGCAALLIREVARRAGLGWVGIVLFAAAFGILQAGVWDQSLFSPDYRGIEGWEEDYRSTLIAPLGLNAYNALTFVGGHVVVSICAPIALIEATVPSSARQPWLGRFGLILTGVAWVAASVLVLVWHLQTEDSHASAGQLTGAAGVSIALIAAAYLLRPRSRRTVAAPSGRWAPRVATVFVAGVVLFGLLTLFPTNWWGVAAQIAGFGLGATALLVACRRRGWGIRQIAAAAAAPLLVQGALAFTYDPVIGEVSTLAKYAHNVVMLVIVLGVVALAFTAARSAGDIDRPGQLQAGRTAG